MNEKIVGIRLKQLREKTGLSQAKFAKVLGDVSQPVIARYETGDFFPSYPVLIKIADYFNVSTDYLLGRTDNPAGKLYEQAESKEKTEDFIKKLNISKNFFKKTLDKYEKFAIIKIQKERTEQKMFVSFIKMEKTPMN